MPSRVTNTAAPVRCGPAWSEPSSARASSGACARRPWPAASEHRASASAGCAVPSPPAALAFSRASLAASRSARFSRISTIVGQSSLRQSFHGRPGPRFFTVSRGRSPQTEHRSSRRQSSKKRPGRGPLTRQESGDSGSSRFQPSQPYMRLPPLRSMIRSRLGSPLSRLRPASSQTLHGPEELVLVHPLPDLLGEVLLLFLELGGGRVQHLAADPHDLVLGGLTGGDLVHVELELGGHLRRRHPRHVLVKGLVEGDPGLGGNRRIGIGVTAVVELLDDVGARRLGPEAALLHQLDQLALADPRGRLGLLVDDPRLAVELEALALVSAGISSSEERA